MDKSTCINALKVLAALCVFFKHSLIPCFGYEITTKWQIAFNTPAWGGVWIFLVIGGFLACNGFDKGKYKLDKNGVLKYYKNRVVKILIPTWIFLSLAILIDQNAKFEPFKWMSWLLCTYNGNGINVRGISATWYVFVIMWCYLFTPPLLYILRKMEVRYGGNEIRMYAILLLILLMWGLVYRVGGFAIGIDWYNWLYANVIACLDIYLIGMFSCRIVKYLPENPRRYEIYGKVLFAILFALIVFCTSRNIYVRAFYKLASSGLYAFLCSGILICYFKKNHKHVRSKWHNTINYCAQLSFMFYLWHMVVMVNLSRRIPNNDILFHYLAVMLLGFIITTYVAYLMTKMNNAIISKYI